MLLELDGLAWGEFWPVFTGLASVLNDPVEGLIKSFNCLWKICFYHPNFVMNSPLIWIPWVLSGKCWCKDRLRMLLCHWLAVSTLSAVTRSNITTMSGPNRLSFVAVTLPKLRWKDVFSSYFCAHGEHRHLLCRTPAIVFCSDCPPPPQPAMTQFPLTLVWLILNQAFHWFFRSPLAAFQAWILFPVPLSEHHCTAVILSLS